MSIYVEHKHIYIYANIYLSIYIYGARSKIIFDLLQDGCIQASSQDLPIAFEAGRFSNGSFQKLGLRLVVVLVTRVLLFGVYIKGP